VTPRLVSHVLFQKNIRGWEFMGIPHTTDLDNLLGPMFCAGERKAGLNPLLDMTEEEERDVENLLSYTHQARKIHLSNSPRTKK
jgi:hypothetical protein